ncbi:MAG TPA: Dabb family protein [Paracoccaceae bacterium]
MLQHCVFCAIRDDVDEASLAAVMRRLEALTAKVDGMTALRWGPNRDYEAKSPGFSHGFVATFADRAAHLAYEAHPEHQAAGMALVALCRGGHAGIVVYDLEVG